MYHCFYILVFSTKPYLDGDNLSDMKSIIKTITYLDGDNLGYIKLIIKTIKYLDGETYDLTSILKTITYLDGDNLDDLKSILKTITYLDGDNLDDIKSIIKSGLALILNKGSHVQLCPHIIAGQTSNTATVYSRPTLTSVHGHNYVLVNG